MKFDRLLWMLYIGLILLGQLDYKWSLKTSAWLVIGSLLPFGPFIADAKLLKRYESPDSTR